MFVLYVHMWFFCWQWIYYCLIDLLLSIYVHFYRYIKGCTQTHQTCSFTVIFSTQTDPYPVDFDSTLSSPQKHILFGPLGSLFLSNTFHPHLAAFGSCGSPFPPLNKKIKKVIVNFLSHNSDFFLRIAWYKLPIANKVRIVRCKLAIVRGGVSFFP